MELSAFKSRCVPSTLSRSTLYHLWVSLQLIITAAYIHAADFSQRSSHSNETPFDIENALARLSGIYIVIWLGAGVVVHRALRCPIHLRSSISSVRRLAIGQCHWHGQPSYRSYVVNDLIRLPPGRLCT